jgi:hypothetical protein
MQPPLCKLLRLGTVAKVQDQCPTRYESEVVAQLAQYSLQMFHGTMPLLRRTV